MPELWHAQLREWTEGSGRVDFPVKQSSLTLLTLLHIVTSCRESDLLILGRTHCVHKGSRYQAQHQPPCINLMHPVAQCTVGFLRSPLASTIFSD